MYAGDVRVCACVCGSGMTVRERRSESRERTTYSKLRAHFLFIQTRINIQSQKYLTYSDIMLVLSSFTVWVELAWLTFLSVLNLSHIRYLRNIYFSGCQSVQVSRCSIIGVLLRKCEMRRRCNVLTYVGQFFLLCLIWRLRESENSVKLRMDNAYGILRWMVLDLF